jgi:PAS domain S-box-containing protein
LPGAEPPPSRHSTAIDPLERRTFVWSAVGLGMLVMISLTGAWTLRQINRSDLWIDHTHEVIRYDQQLLSDVKDAESAERGYIITGEEAYRIPYDAAVQDTPRILAKLQELMADNPAQQERLRNLQPLIGQRFVVFENALRQRKDSGLEAAQRIVLAGQGRAASKRIRDAIQQMESEEYRLLEQRSRSRQARITNGFLAVLGASVLALLAFLSAPFDVRRAVRQRNLAAQAQKQSESTTHALFEAAAQAIFLVDRQGRIVMANPATSAMFGYAPNELIGESIELLIPDHLRRGHVEHRSRYFENPQSRAMGLGLDLRARRRDGSEFAAEISLNSVQSTQGTLAVAFVTDISKRKSDEQAIREQREDLRSLAGRLMTAQDDERRRIARDLHDDLSQRLAFLAMDLGKLATKPSAHELIADLRPLQLRAAEAAETVRRISHQLHPSVLDDIGLEAALEQYAEEFEQRSGITTQFTSRNMPDSLPMEVASSIYHIAQECLRNVSKHSRTETVSVDLEFRDKLLRLTIKDQGIGLDADQSDRGIGIVAMKERAHLVNGKISIQSKTGAGTEVSVEVPVGASV